MVVVDRSDLMFDYSMNIFASSDMRLLDAWDVTASHTTYTKKREEKIVPVAFARFVVVDFYRLMMAEEEPFAYVDWYSQELGQAIGVLVDSWNVRPRTLELTRGSWPVAILFMERVEVVRRYRGQRLGRLLAAEAIATLGRGCDFVLAQPSPTERSPAYGSEELKAQERALRRYWAGIGFRSFVQSYSVLELYGNNRKLDRHLLRWDSVPATEYYW